MAATRAEELVEILKELDQGNTMVEFHSALRETVQAVRETGKPGKVILSLAVAPKGSNKVTVQDEVKTTIPRPDKQKATFFATEDGALSRQDPDQPSLPGLTIRAAE